MCLLTPKELIRDLRYLLCFSSLLDLVLPQGNTPLTYTHTHTHAHTPNPAHDYPNLSPELEPTFDSAIVTVTENPDHQDRNVSINQSAALHLIHDCHNSTLTRSHVEAVLCH